MKNLKIINKNKFIMTIVILVIICISLCLILINKSYSNSNVNYKKEYVYEGDTLWKIAEKETKSNPYYKNEDIRKVMYDIKEFNSLESSNLYEGLEIKIPVY